MIRNIERIAQVIASLRGLGVVDRQLHTEILRRALEVNSAYVRVWSVWDADAFDGRDKEFANSTGHDSTGRFVPCWQRLATGIALEPVKDYADSDSGAWYRAAKSYGEICAIDAHLTKLGEESIWAASEAAPILEHGRCIGVVGIDYHTVAPATRSEPVPSSRRAIRVIGRSGNADKLRSLTEREREVYYWLCEGKSNDEIGIVLGISTHTVKNHLERIFTKLGVENRISAALVSQTFV